MQTTIAWSGKNPPPPLSFSLSFFLSLLLSHFGKECEWHRGKIVGRLGGKGRYKKNQGILLMLLVSFFSIRIHTHIEMHTYTHIRRSGLLAGDVVEKIRLANDFSPYESVA